jgi:hypothetical protein
MQNNIKSEREFTAKRSEPSVVKSQSRENSYSCKRKAESRKKTATEDAICTIAAAPAR